MEKSVARVNWIKDQLRSGHAWNASALAAEFKVSPKTAQRTIDLFREIHPDWHIRYDAKEKTYFLDEPLPIEKPPRRPDRFEMSAAEFAGVRKRIALTQAQLANCIDSREATIGQWERGEKRIPTDIVLLMRAWDRARLFGHWQGRQRKIYRRNIDKE